MVKIKIKQWLGVASWNWNVENEDVCGICRAPFESCPPGVKYPGDDCPPVFGQCNHALHMQCLMTWLESQQNVRQECPMCRQLWTFRDADSSNNANNINYMNNANNNNTTPGNPVNINNTS